MTALVLLAALATPIRMDQIREMGCHGPSCITLAQLAKMPADRIPAGCQLKSATIAGQTKPVPILICRERPAKDSSRKK